MADTTTTNYALVKPAVNDPAGADTWGGKLNTNLDALDAQIKAIDGVSAAAKATPIDADWVGTYDSAVAGTPVKKTLWSQVKAFLKTYFDTIYLGLGGGALTGAVTTTAGLTVIGNSNLRVRSGTTEALLYYDASDFYVLFTDSVGATFNSTRALRASRNGNLYTQGDMIASGTVWAGGGSNGRMGADGNLWGTAYGSDWLTNYIENRAIAWANNRVSSMSYRYVSQGTTTSASGGYYSTPGGAMLKSIATGGGSSVMFKYIQVYDPVRGWVGFGEA
jgi:hypothetical protein